MSVETVSSKYNKSQNLAWSTVTLVYNGTNKVDCSGDYEDWKPTSVRLRNQLCRQRTTHYAWYSCLQAPRNSHITQQLGSRVQKWIITTIKQVSVVTVNHCITATVLQAIVRRQTKSNSCWHLCRGKKQKIGKVSGWKCNNFGHTQNSLSIQWLVQMEWRPAGWSVCLPLLISPCTIKSRSFSSGTGSPGWSREKGRKMVVVVQCRISQR